jgi:hypothetical protein
VSADAFTDNANSASYYRAEITLDGELAYADQHNLIPGMLVEAFIRTADRTVRWPLSDYIARTFRDG